MNEQFFLAQLFGALTFGKMYTPLKLSRQRCEYLAGHSNSRVRVSGSDWSSDFAMPPDAFLE